MNPQQKGPTSSTTLPFVLTAVLAIVMSSMGCSIAGNGSCKRDLQVPELVDDWDWVQTVGGWGGTSTPESTGTTASLTIGSDCVATLFVNGGLVGQTAFEMRVGADTLLHLSNDSLWGREYLAMAAADRLLLADRCDHCDYHYFERSVMAANPSLHRTTVSGYQYRRRRFVD